VESVTVVVISSSDVEEIVSSISDEEGVVVNSSVDAMISIEDSPVNNREMTVSDSDSELLVFSEELSEDDEPDVELEVSDEHPSSSLSSPSLI
jgi:hypothetical protein